LKKNAQTNMVATLKRHASKNSSAAALLALYRGLPQFSAQKATLLERRWVT